MMVRNIFILALEDDQLDELKTIRNAEAYAFHSVMTVDTLVEAETIAFNRVLAQCRREIDAAGTSVDGIVAHWDFPTSVLAPILCADYGIPSPSLDSVLKCEHKYWSRLEQARSIPDLVPAFCAFDPFSDDPLAEIDLAYPFWIKPIKSFSSQFGFQIDSAKDFHIAIKKMRAGIRRIGDAFDEVLARVELPPEIRRSTGRTAIAEEIVTGTQIASEGSVYRGEFNVHGVLDMHKDLAGHSFGRLQYPSSHPESVQQRVNDACERYLHHIGFDNGCFNAEFMWDRDRDLLRLIEFNTRISQSHSQMFINVDGMSNHEVAVDVATGQPPAMPYRQGRYKVAAKCIIPQYGDGKVTLVPSAAAVREVERRFPGTHVHIDVEPGMYLHDLSNQDSYCYIVGVIYLGADSEEELLARLDTCLEMLRFDISPLEAAS